MVNGPRKVSQVVVFQEIPDFLPKIPFPSLTVKTCENYLKILKINMNKYEQERVKSARSQKV